MEGVKIGNRVTPMTSKEAAQVRAYVFGGPDNNVISTKRFLSEHRHRPIEDFIKNNKTSTKLSLRKKKMKKKVADPAQSSFSGIDNVSPGVTWGREDFNATQAQFESELELSIIRAILHREGLLKQLRASLRKFSDRKSCDPTDICNDLLPLIRKATIAVCEKVLALFFLDTWKQGFIEPRTYFFEGENYLLKIPYSLCFMDTIPKCRHFIGFDLHRNPLILEKTRLHKSKAKLLRVAARAINAARMFSLNSRQSSSHLDDDETPVHELSPSALRARILRKAKAEEIEKAQEKQNVIDNLTNPGSSPPSPVMHRKKVNIDDNTKQKILEELSEILIEEEERTHGKIEDYSRRFCLWCSGDYKLLTCGGCRGKVCRTCIEINFGKQYYSNAIKSSSWECWRCNKKRLHGDIQKEKDRRLRKEQKILASAEKMRRMRLRAMEAGIPVSGSRKRSMKEDSTTVKDITVGGNNKVIRVNSKNIKKHHKKSGKSQRKVSKNFPSKEKKVTRDAINRKKVLSNVSSREKTKGKTSKTRRKISVKKELESDLIILTAEYERLRKLVADVRFTRPPSVSAWDRKGKTNINENTKKSLDNTDENNVTHDAWVENHRNTLCDLSGKLKVVLQKIQKAREKLIELARPSTAAAAKRAKERASRRREKRKKKSRDSSNNLENSSMHATDNSNPAQELGISGANIHLTPTVEINQDRKILHHSIKNVMKDENFEKDVSTVLDLFDIDMDIPKPKCIQHKKHKENNEAAFNDNVELKQQCFDECIADLHNIIISSTTFIKTSREILIVEKLANDSLKRDKKDIENMLNEDISSIATSTSDSENLLWKDIVKLPQNFIEMETLTRIHIGNYDKAIREFRKIHISDYEKRNGSLFPITHQMKETIGDNSTNDSTVNSLENLNKLDEKKERLHQKYLLFLQRDMKRIESFVEAAQKEWKNLNEMDVIAFSDDDIQRSKYLWKCLFHIMQELRPFVENMATMISHAQHSAESKQSIEMKNSKEVVALHHIPLWTSLTMHAIPLVENAETIFAKEQLNETSLATDLKSLFIKYNTPLDVAFSRATTASRSASRAATSSAISAIATSAKPVQISKAKHDLLRDQKRREAKLRRQKIAKEAEMQKALRKIEDEKKKKILEEKKEIKRKRAAFALEKHKLEKEGGVSKPTPAAKAKYKLAKPSIERKAPNIVNDPTKSKPLSKVSDKVTKTIMDRKAPSIVNDPTKSNSISKVPDKVSGKIPEQNEDILSDSKIQILSVKQQLQQGDELKDMMQRISAATLNISTETSEEWQARRATTDAELKAGLLAAGIDLSSWNEPDDAAAITKVEGIIGNTLDQSQRMMLRGMHIAGIDTSVLPDHQLRSILGGKVLQKINTADSTKNNDEAITTAKEAIIQENADANKRAVLSPEETAEHLRIEHEKKIQKRQERIEHTSQQIITGSIAGGKVGGSSMMIKPK